MSSEFESKEVYNPDNALVGAYGGACEIQGYYVCYYDED